MELGKSSHENNILNKKNKKSAFQLLFQQVIDYRYLFLASFLISLIVAYLINRYTKPVYMVSTSILVNEKESSSKNLESLLYGEGRATTPVNILSQEIAVLGSSSFIYRTLDSLDSRISYFIEGKIGKNEVYENLPIQVILNDKASAYKIINKRFKISFSNDSNYTLFNITPKNSTAGKYKFGNKVFINGCPITVRTTTYFNPNTNKSLAWEFFIQDLHDHAQEIKNEINLRTDGLEGSSVIYIYLPTNVPQKGIDFLNEYTAQYIKYKYQEKDRSASQALAFIDDQLNIISSALTGTESSLENFKTSNTYSDASKMTDRNFDALTQLENDRSMLLVNERYYNSMLNDLSGNKGLNKLVAPSSLGIQDALTDNLIKQLADLQIEKNTFSSEGNSKNPLLQDIDSKITNIKNTLRENIKNLLNNNKIKLNQTNLRRSQYQSNVTSLPKAERRYIDIKRNNTLNESVYQLLMQKKIEASILRAAATVENKVIEPAFLTSIEPLKPKKYSTYTFALLTGLGIPLVILWIKRIFNKRIYGREGIYEITSIPLIGTIYHNKEKASIVINSDSKTATSESFRMIREYLNTLKKNTGKKVFQVTSTSSNEGKSFTSLNLAISLAISKKKTVLLNLDLRVINDLFNTYGSRLGISSFLKEDIDHKQVIYETDNGFLHYVPAGRLPDNPSDLFTEEKLGVLFDYLKENYEYIIVDTPPLSIVVDSYIIAKYTDFNLIVVRDRYSLKDKLYDLDEIYRDGIINDLGIILNDVKLDVRRYENGCYLKR